jgi:hypothetical protein
VKPCALVKADLRISDFRDPGNSLAASHSVESRNGEACAEKDAEFSDRN